MTLREVKMCPEENGLGGEDNKDIFQGCGWRGALDPERENTHGKKWGCLFLFLLKLIDWLRFQRKRIWCELCETWMWERSRGSRASEGRIGAGRAPSLSAPGKWREAPPGRGCPDKSIWRERVAGLGWEPTEYLGGRCQTKGSEEGMGEEMQKDTLNTPEGAVL